MRHWLDLMRRRHRIAHMEWRLSIWGDFAVQEQLDRERWALECIQRGYLRPETYPPNKAGSR
jgi:hypothetical protein